MASAAPRRIAAGRGAACGRVQAGASGWPTTTSRPSRRSRSTSIGVP